MTRPTTRRMSYAKEEANKEKPNHPSAETVVKQVLAVRVSRERRRRSRAREPKLLQLRRDLDALSLEAGAAVGLENVECQQKGTSAPVAFRQHTSVSPSGNWCSPTSREGTRWSKGRNLPATTSKGIRSRTRGLGPPRKKRRKTSRQGS